MNYAYLRVSRDTQDVNNQKHGVVEYCDRMRFNPVAHVEDTASGAIHWKERKLGDLLENSVIGDRIVVSEFTRLARSTLGVLEVLEAALAKGVEIHIVKENFVYDGSINAHIMATFFGLAGQIERSMISARTKEGLAKRKAEGMILGRPLGSSGSRKLDHRKLEFKALWKSDMPRAAIARLMGVHIQTINSYAVKIGLKDGKETK